MSLFREKYLFFPLTMYKNDYKNAWQMDRWTVHHRDKTDRQTLK